jgi:hypothetical protein
LIVSVLLSSNDQANAYRLAPLLDYTHLPGIPKNPLKEQGFSPTSAPAGLLTGPAWPTMLWPVS